MDQYFKSYTPRHRIKIFSIKGVEKFDISDDLASLATNKAYGRCSGTWQLMLPYKSPTGKTDFYHKLIDTDDIVTIELDPGDGTGFQHVMTGMVDRVGVVRQGGVAPIRQIKLSGRDLGKLLEKHDVSYDVIVMNEMIPHQPDTPAIEAVPTQSRLVDPAVTTGTSAKIIKYAFENFFKPYLTAGNRYSIVVDTDDDWITTQPNMMQQTNTPFWDYIRQVQDAPYNVLHTDADPLQAGRHVLTLERYPADDFGRLSRSASKTATIDDTEIISDDLAICDAERVNYLFHIGNLLMTSPSLCKDSWAASLGVKDYDSIKDHGFCNWTVNNGAFTPPGLKTNKDTNAEDVAFTPSIVRQAIIWQWFKDNHDRIAGSMTIHLRPDIRAGWQLLAKEGNTDKYISYLVEQVSHQYTIHPMPQFTTTLHVTRGQYTTPAQKEMIKPAPEPVKPEPKPEPPPPKPYDCDAAKAKIEGIREDYKKLYTNYNKKVAEGTATAAERQSLVELKASWSKEINSIADEAQANGCTNIPDSMRSPPTPA